MSYRSKNKTGRAVCWLLFLCYIAALVYLLFFSESQGRTGGIGDGGFQYNLVPFEEILRFIKYRAILGTEAVVVNLAGNVIGFMPFGFLLPLLSEKERRLLMILLLTFELSLVVEVLQLFTGRGSFDVDDLLLNTLGGVLGYGCYSLFVRLSKSSGRG